VDPIPTQFLASINSTMNIVRTAQVTVCTSLLSEFAGRMAGNPLFCSRAWPSVLIPDSILLKGLAVSPDSGLYSAQGPGRQS
jgi:hypothetical protein